MFVEHKVNGVWKNVYKPEKYRGWLSYNAPITVRNYYGYERRNYFLFGILAGVRGSEKPIAFPRGLPKNVNPGIKKESDKYGTAGHSHSWLTLKELLNYNWHKKYDNNDFRTLNALQRLKRRLKYWKKEGYDIQFSDIVDNFYDMTLMRLTLLDDNSDNIRIVFWFDS